MWWEGPAWLSQEPAAWPRRLDINDDREMLELKPVVLLSQVAVQEMWVESSNFLHIVRVLAWMRRAYLRMRCKIQPSSPHLESREVTEAKVLLLKHTQLVTFPEAMRSLHQHQFLPQGHSLSPLSPYLDNDGILRVGGRLQKASIAADAAHPIS